MKNRCFIVLTLLATLGGSRLVAGQAEEKQAQALAAFRGLCETLVAQSPDEGVRQRSQRFLQLSGLRTWTDADGRSIQARYLGHGRDSSGETVIFLQKPSGTQHGVRPAILSRSSQAAARELAQLVDAVAQDAKAFRNDLWVAVENAKRVDVDVTATVGRYPGQVYPGLPWPGYGWSTSNWGWPYYNPLPWYYDWPRPYQQWGGSYGPYLIQSTLPKPPYATGPW